MSCRQPQLLPWLPTPTRTRSLSPEFKKKNKIIKILKYLLAARTAENIRKLLCCSAPSTHKKERKRKLAATRRIDIFSSNGGRLKLNFDIIFKVENVGFFFFFFLGRGEVEQQWCYNRKHIDIVIKSLPTFCLLRNYHSLRRNVNIVFVRGGNMEFLYLE